MSGEQCRSCCHPAHLGACTARSGGTAYQCCCTSTPESVEYEMFKSFAVTLGDAYLRWLDALASGDRVLSNQMHSRMTALGVDYRRMRAFVWPPYTAPLTTKEDQ